MKASLLSTSVFLALCSTSFGTVLLTDDFSYPDGDLTTSAAWSNHSGSGSFVQVTSQTITLVQGSGSREDVNASLGITMGAGETYYASFDVTVSGGSTTAYFAHFKDSATGFNGRIFVAAPSSGGDFTFGLSDVGSSPDTTFATDFSFNTSYKLVVSYDYDTGLSELWVNPTSEASPSISSVTADPSQPMEAFAFRQGSGNSTEVIDNLVVATTFAEVVPEPSITLLGGIGLLGLLRRRR
ncbi:PEP-CTERM sorting domain-containing protein [Haloferula sargassicola]|uniref:Ice-binding protein C-terminal domain-containing protein n=1 Tax=Haloferula sargassicola TaxID=490096 RepID=A0ABP9UM37_9BACT